MTGICYGCQRPNPEVRGIDGELYHRDCRREHAKEMYRTGRRRREVEA